jgi:hypothetical protein
LDLDILSKEAVIDKWRENPQKPLHRLTNRSKIMNQNFTGYNPSISKKIKTEQIEQIIKAIISGKYSWACVLVLQFAGYNPTDYMPYRTYIRLLKDNRLLGNSQKNQPPVEKVDRFDVKSLTFFQTRKGKGEILQK